jgi:glycosyltransferase involved in cell wall biosynthesis
MLSVIIPSYRNPKYLDLCLKSLIDGQVNTNEIIVTLDGYVEESQHLMEKYPTVSWLPFEENQGFQTAINYAVWNANNPYVFVINDDQVFPNEWDRRLSTVINSIVDINNSKWVLTVNQVESVHGMYNFPVNSTLNNNCDEFLYDKWVEYEKTISVSDKITNDGHIFPFVVQKKWFMAIGGLDTFYISPQVCDYDMFLKWELLGFQFLRTHALHLYHFGSVVTRKGPEASQFRQKEAQATMQYDYKWGTGLYNKPIENSKIPPDGKFKGFIV